MPRQRTGGNAPQLLDAVFGGSQMVPVEDFRPVAGQQRLAPWRNCATMSAIRMAVCRTICRETSVSI